MVISGEVFTLVTQLFYSLTTLPAYMPVTANIRTCAHACLASIDCGGFVWNTTTSLSCQLVVDPSVTGATASSATMVYRRHYYRGKGIIEPPDDLYSWDSLVIACAAMNAKIIDYPKTNQEKALLLIRGCERLFVDLNNKANQNTLTYKNKNGTVADMAYIDWYAPDLDMGAEQCLLMKYSPGLFFDLWCDFSYTTSADACAFCTEE